MIIFCEEAREAFYKTMIYTIKCLYKIEEVYNELNLNEKAINFYEEAFFQNNNLTDSVECLDKIEKYKKT